MLYFYQGITIKRMITFSIYYCKRACFWNWENFWRCAKEYFNEDNIKYDAHKLTNITKLYVLQNHFKMLQKFLYHCIGTKLFIWENLGVVFTLNIYVQNSYNTYAYKRCRILVCQNFICQAHISFICAKKKRIVYFT